MSIIMRSFLVLTVLVCGLGGSLSLSLPFSTKNRGQGCVQSPRTTRCISSFPSNNRQVVRHRKPSLKQKYMSVTDTASSSPDPSSSVDSMTSLGETTTTQTKSAPSSVVPSYRKLLIFAGTTVLIWLSEPLLSLVDTTVVGRSTSTSAHNTLIELAALGPATMLIDSGIYITYFLAIATTNVMAKSLAKRDLPALRRHSSHVLGVASVLGSIVTAVVFALGKPLLASWTAGSSSSEQLLEAAFSYSKIRSLVAPFVIMYLVAQSICLACLDMTTPVVAIIVASVVNIVGDVLLVTKFGMGIQGAAVATAVASVASSLVLLREVKKKMRDWKRQEQEELGLKLHTRLEVEDAKNDTAEVGSSNQTVAIDNETSEQGTGKESLASNSTLGPVDGVSLHDSDGPEHMHTGSSKEGVGEKGTTVNGSNKRTKEASNSVQDIPLISFPDYKALIKLIKLSGPICFVIVGKVVCYSAMTLRATDFGVVSLATHNIMMRLFYFFATFGDSISQSSQTFVPKVVYHNDEQQEDNSQVDMHNLLLKLGTVSSVIGVVISVIAGWIMRNCGSSFTKDPAIIKLMGDHTGFFVLSLLFHPFIMFFEGSLVATRDFSFLVGTFSIIMGLLIAQLKFACNDFAGVWKALFVFQMLRLAQFSTRFVKKIVTAEVKPATK